MKTWMNILLCLGTLSSWSAFAVVTPISQRLENFYREIEEERHDHKKNLVKHVFGALPIVVLFPPSIDAIFSAHKDRRHLGAFKNSYHSLSVARTDLSNTIAFAKRKHGDEFKKAQVFLTGFGCHSFESCHVLAKFIQNQDKLCMAQENRCLFAGLAEKDFKKTDFHLALLERIISLIQAKKPLKGFEEVDDLSDEEQDHRFLLK